MGSVFISGLATGLDTTGIISELVEVYSAPQKNLEGQKASTEDELDLVGELQDLVEALEAAVEEIDTPEELRALAVSNSDPDAATVTVDPESAAAGTYTLVVTSLASAETEVSAEGFASADAALGTGTLSLTVGGVTTEITVDAANGNDTLEDLAAYINENVDGVTAYVLHDGSGTVPYRLVVQGEDTGAANTLSMTASLSTALTFTETVAASDAEMTLNGIAVQSASNTLAGAVPGVTIELEQAGTGPIEIRVEEDPDGVVAKLESFVDAYNAVIGFLNDQALDTESGEATELTGDSLLWTVESALSSAITSAFAGGTLSILSQIGFQTEQDGTLSLDADELKDALATDPAGVADLLTGSDKLFDALGAAFGRLLDDESGSITARVDSLNDRIEDLGDQIDDWDRRIVDYEERLIEQFTALELIVAQYKATGDYLAQLFASLQNSE